jgi:IclR family pca regulon transcriptional regulator
VKTSEPTHRTSSSGEYVRGLERGFAVIKAFSADAPSLTIAETAARARLTRAVARRYLFTLEELGYVTREGSLFSLTPRIMELGFTYLSTLPVADIAQPFLERVVERLHLSSSAAILDGCECVYVARVSARRILTTTLVVGSRVPAHATALGKVLLAYLPPEALDAYFERAPLERHTQRTICEEPQLRKALREVRLCGWACADEEYNVGLRTIAAPVFNQAGHVVAAVNVAAAVSLVPLRQLQEDHLPVLLRAARDMSRAFGAPIESPRAGPVARTFPFAVAQARRTAQV